MTQPRSDGIGNVVKQSAGGRFHPNKLQRAVSFKLPTVNTRRTLMIRNLGKLLLALCLLTVGGGIVANAQIETGVVIRAEVPFAFIVGDTTLPAGKYEVRSLGDMPGVLELRSSNGRTVVNVDAESVETKDQKIANKCQLTFDKIGDSYFLSQVWVAGSSSGSELAKSRMEKRLEGSGQTERHSITAMLRRLKP